MTYSPGDIGPTTDLARYIQDELRKIASELNLSTRLAETFIEPSRPINGQTVVADGTEWDPGNGRGVYRYDSTTGTWIFVEGVEITEALIIATLNPLTNGGFEVGDPDDAGTPLNWFMEVSDDVENFTLHDDAGAASGSTGIQCFGADDSTNSGVAPGGVGYFKVGKQFEISSAGGVLTVTAVCKLYSATTAAWNGTYTSGVQTFLAEDDAFIEVRCYAINGSTVTLTAAQQYSLSASHQDYDVNGARNVSGLWLALTHTLTIPTNTFRVDVLLCGTDGGNAVGSLGAMGVDAGVLFDDIGVKYPPGIREVSSSTWSAEAGASLGTTLGTDTQDEDGNIIGDTDVLNFYAPKDNLIADCNFLDADSKSWVFTPSAGGWERIASGENSYSPALEVVCGAFADEVKSAIDTSTLVPIAAQTRFNCVLRVSNDTGDASALAIRVDAYDKSMNYLVGEEVDATTVNTNGTWETVRLPLQNSANSARYYGFALVANATSGTLTVSHFRVMYSNSFGFDSLPKSIKSSGFLSLTRQSKTISSGVISISTSRIILTPEGGTGADDLDTINIDSTAEIAGSDTEGNLISMADTIVILSIANSSHTITVKNGTGNITLDADATLDNVADMLMLIRNTSGTWQGLAFKDNGT